MYLNDTPVEQVGAAFWAVVGRLRATGVTVTALLAGAGNGTWECIRKNPPQAMSVLKALTNAPYNLQGFDLDWETGAYDPQLVANVTNNLAAARPGMVITHAPTTDLLSTYTTAFWNAVGPNLAWINVQWYGDADLVTDYYDFVTGQTSGAAVDPSRVVAGATVVAQPGVEYTDLCQLMTMVNTIQKKPGIGSKIRRRGRMGVYSDNWQPESQSFQLGYMHCGGLARPDQMRSLSIIFVVKPTLTGRLFAPGCLQVGVKMDVANYF